MKHYIILLLSFVSSLTLFAESLPRVDLHYTTFAADTFNVGSFRFVNGTDTISLGMKVRHRGATSLMYDKPSYAIKLIDSLGNNFDASFLGMREDNYWILDAMASDKARMRNRVSLDLWLAFSRKPWYAELEPKMINGYRGEMVEVYVNDQPYGIYCLMERVDRKQLKLKKYSEKKGVQGLLYKNTSWTLLARYWIDYRNPRPDTSMVWDGWEQKEPDPEDGEPISWQQLEHHVNVCRKTTGKAYPDTLKLHLDIPVFVDYVLFTQLLSARDNVNKNRYLSFYNANIDQRALYTPWDLDHSWGRQYNSIEEATDAQLSWESNYLYIRMMSYYGLQDTLEARYAELRKHYFTIDYIDALFAPYFEQFAQTGMDTIEQKIWSGHNDISFDIASEQAYIHNWVVARLAYLDEYYHYSPDTPSVLITLPASATETCLPPTKQLQDGHLYIRQSDHLYDCLGRLIQ